MRFDQPLTAADPVALASSLGAAQASLGAAVTARNAANRRWRDALLGDDLAELRDDRTRDLGAPDVDSDGMHEQGAYRLA